jgi:hypothetical protein
MNFKPKQIYYDIQLNNFESLGNASLPLRFSETRNNPIIKNSQDYSLSIVRFQLDTYSLPSYIADIEPFPNTDVNKMIETISMEYETSGGISGAGPTNLIWKSTNLHVKAPSKPAPLQESQTEYYYGNSFRHYCDIVNNCFITLTNELKTNGGVALNDLLPPLLIWNEQTNTAELLAQELFYNSSRTNHVNIYFNRALYAKFTSLPALKDYSGGSGRIYKIYMKDDYSTKSVLLDINGTDQLFIKTGQEYSTISNWSAVSSIVFTTNTLPIVGTQMSEPLVYYNGNAISSKIAQNSALIISDMATNDLCYKPNLLYVPSAQYRYIDMIGTNDITTIDINVYWKDKKGHLNPFFLQSGASASIKMLFELKV